MLKTITSDKLTVQICETRREMGDLAGHDIAEYLRKLLAEQDEVNMIFAAAPSQNETLEALCAAEGIDWTRVNAFHMDEYIGLPEGAPQTFVTYLYDHIFGKLPFRNIFCIRGFEEDIEAECARYTALLEEYPTDIVCLGIGENGHIAFNDPWIAQFNDDCMIKKVPLDEVCRMQQVHDGCFPELEDVPTHALSLTIPALTKAKAMFCSVPAKTKREAVTRTVNERISEDCPATIMRLHDHAVMYVDSDSGADLL